MNKHWTTITVLALLALVTLGLARPAQAADIREGQDLVIPAGEVIDDDLFLFASRIEMNGTVKGDLIAFGQEVVINGTVEGSLVVGGQTVTVNGEVQGSAYGGAYALMLGPAASIDKNVYGGAFSVSAEEGSAVGRDLYAGAYQAILDGEISDEAVLGLAALELNGKVGGDVQAYVDRPDPGFAQSAPFMRGFMPQGVNVIEPGLRIGLGAEIGGDLRYTSPVEQAVPSGTIGGSVVFSTPVPGAQPDVRDPGRFPVRTGVGITRRIGEFIALLIVGGVLLRWWPAVMQRASAQAQTRPLPSAGWGCLVSLIAAVGVPVAAILIFLVALLGGLVTLGDLFGDLLGLGAAALGLAITVFLFVVALVTKAIVLFLGGRLILDRLAPQRQTGSRGDFWALASGALIYEILRFIPLLGWLLDVSVTLIGLGAIYFALRERYRPAAPLAPTAPPAVPAAA